MHHSPAIQQSLECVAAISLKVATPRWEWEYAQTTSSQEHTWHRVGLVNSGVFVSLSAERVQVSAQTCRSVASKLLAPQTKTPKPQTLSAKPCCAS